MSLGLDIRPARYEDCGWFYDLAMSPEVRKNSVRSALFTREEHDQWWDKRFDDTGTVMYVGTLLPLDNWSLKSEQIVGHVRYGKTEDMAELAISILPEFRGYGYGTELLLKTEAMAQERLDVRTAVALILPENTASKKTFIRAGYEFQWVTERMNKTVYRYEKVISPAEAEWTDPRSRYL